MTKALFYSHFGCDPWFNMAFDEWMLSRVVDRTGSVILRLYTWDRDTITFGYHQRQEKALDFSSLGDTPAIRRITGGRALLHDPSELTYSVAANIAPDGNSPLAGSLSSVSKAIALSLQAFLQEIGISADYARRSHAFDRDPAALHTEACFASHARHELTSGGSKIVASAQRRLADAFLQHGSIKLGGVSPHPALGGKSADTCELPRLVESEQFDGLAELFQRTMASHASLDLISPELTNGELEQIQAAATAMRKKPLQCREPLNSQTSRTVL